MKKQTKKQLFEILLTSSYRRPFLQAHVLDDVCTLNEFKKVLLEQVNKFYCINEQLSNKYQWYLGYPYRYNKREIDEILSDLNYAVLFMGYELEYNGFYHYK